MYLPEISACMNHLYLILVSSNFLFVCSFLIVMNVIYMYNIINVEHFTIDLWFILWMLNNSNNEK